MVVLVQQEFLPASLAFIPAGHTYHHVVEEKQALLTEGKRLGRVLVCQFALCGGVPHGICSGIGHVIWKGGLVWREQRLSENGGKSGCEEKEGRCEWLKEKRSEMCSKCKGCDGCDNVGNGSERADNAVELWQAVGEKERRRSLRGEAVQKEKGRRPYRLSLGRCNDSEGEGEDKRRREK